MIIETPTSAHSSGSAKMLEKTVALDSPPAYSDIGSGYDHERQSHPGQIYSSQSCHVQRPPAHPSQSLHPSQSYRVRVPPPRNTSRVGPVNVNAEKTPTVPPVPAPTVDQVHIYDRKNDIEGNYYIDPSVQPLDPSRRKHKSKEQLPHASFRTRHGEIKLNLATTGDAEKAPKAKIAVSSRSGLIKINLLPVPPSRPRMGLDVNSRHGDVILFLPEGFTGVVELETRKGNMDVLPALASRMKVVKSSDRQIIFMIGNAHEGVDTSREASFCEITTRSGNIIVGLSGRDHYTAPQGFWKRIGGILRGEPSDTKICGAPNS